MNDQQQTFGQKLVGASFNPSQDENVDKIKNAAAAFADAVAEVNGGIDVDPFQQELFDESVKTILIAQMVAVKAATWKK